MSELRHVDCEGIVVIGCSDIEGYGEGECLKCGEKIHFPEQLIKDEEAHLEERQRQVDEFNKKRWREK